MAVDICGGYGSGPTLQSPSSLEAPKRSGGPKNGSALLDVSPETQQIVRLVVEVNAPNSKPVRVELYERPGVRKLVFNLKPSRFEWSSVAIHPTLPMVILSSDSLTAGGPNTSG